MFSLIICLANFWTNSRIDGDVRRINAHSLSPLCYRHIMSSWAPTTHVPTTVRWQATKRPPTVMTASGPSPICWTGAWRLCSKQVLFQMTALYNTFEHIDTGRKLLLFCRWHFQVDFRKTKFDVFWFEFYWNMLSSGLIDTKLALVQIMVWRQTGEKQWWHGLPTHTCGLNVLTTRLKFDHILTHVNREMFERLNKTGV